MFSFSISSSRIIEDWFDSSDHWRGGGSMLYWGWFEWREMGPVVTVVVGEGGGDTLVPPDTHTHSIYLI